jgi:hypothetical protein
MTRVPFDLQRTPKLRPGVKFFRIIGQVNRDVASKIYVGYSHRGIELKFEIASQLLQLLDGSHSLKNILQLLSTNGPDFTSDSVSDLLQILYSANFIEFRDSPVSPQLLRNKHEKVTSEKSEILPVNLINSFNRMRAEENLYSWHPVVDVEKSVEVLIGKRRNFSIIIYGSNRLALALFAVFQASGFGTVKVIDRLGSTNFDSHAQIEPDEVCGLAIRGSDVGLRKTVVLADLARNSQLFPTENLGFPATPDFIISTESIPQEIMQQWMSEAIPHLSISNLIENKIILGPIVLPGNSPCLNCLDLWRAEQFPHHYSFEFLSALDSKNTKDLEIPSAQVALLAGLLATMIIDYCTFINSDGTERRFNAPKLIATTLTLNLLDPLNFETSEDKSVGYRYWQPHLSCGCQSLI